MFNFKIQKDNRGLSLIELICAIAILAIITGTVGGAMVVATRSYRTGTTEAALQQEAQFTANVIESLIIDATKEVKWDGTTLEIINEDNSYRIVYDGAEQTLRYTEYVGGVPQEPQNELLAEHVTGFSVDTSNWDSARNIVLDINMENSTSKYFTSYNVTSRNNPNVAAGATLSAKIKCDTIVVLEPNEVFELPVSVTGASTTFSARVLDDTDNPTGKKTDATAQADSVKITVGGEETGGNDQELHMIVYTDRNGEDGNPLDSVDVRILIRRVREIKIQEVSITGDAGKENAVYTISVPKANFNYDHSNLYMDPVAEARTTDGVNYVDPRKVRWELCSGANEYIEVGSDYATRHNDEITFRLKKDVEPGTTIDVFKAVALHSKGEEPNVSGINEPTNRTGVAYTEAYDIYKITVSNTNSADFARGKLSYVYPNGDKSVEEWIFDETGDTTWNIQTMKIYIRFKSTDGTSKSDGYDNGNWFQGGDGGGKNGNAMFFKFRASDLVTDPNRTFYMKSYKVDILFGVYYQKGNTNEYTWFPTELNDIAGYQGDGRPSQNLPNTITGFFPGASQKGVFSYTLSPVSVEFTDAYKEVWWPSYSKEQLSLASYVRADGLGLGSAANPIPLSKNSPWTFKYEGIGASVVSGGIPSMMNKALVYNVSNPSEAAKTGMVQWEANGMANADMAEWINDGKFTLRNTGSLQTGATYKLVFDEFEGYGTEYYSSGSGVEGKGEIYFKVTD